MSTIFKGLLTFLLLSNYAHITFCDISQPSEVAPPSQDSQSYLELILQEQTIDQNTIAINATLVCAKTGQYLGYIIFEYNSSTKQGHISRLHVTTKQRKKSYGSILLQFALDTLTECDCQKIDWTAYPFDLPANENRQSMLPKLIAFYERHGAELVSKGENSAQIVFDPKKARKKNLKKESASTQAQTQV